MKNFLIACGLLLTACGGGAKPSTTPAATGENVTAAETGGDGQPEVDPTVPSWAPKTCIAYHRAVVQAVDCEPLEQGKRDAIKTKYAGDSESWKTVEATAAKIEEIKAYCESQTASVRGDIGTHCVK